MSGLVSTLGGLDMQFVYYELAFLGELPAFGQCSLRCFLGRTGSFPDLPVTSKEVSIASRFSLDRYLAGN